MGEYPRQEYRYDELIPQRLEERQDKLQRGQRVESIPMHGIDKRQAAEYIGIPERYTMIFPDKVGIERAEEDSGLDRIGAEQHFIAEDEACENSDGPHQKKKIE